MNQSRVTSPKITAYLKEQCGWSRGRRSILNKYGLRFEEKQIHIPENYQEMVEKSRQSLQPTLLLDDLVLADISGDELESFLLSNKYVGSKLAQLDGIDTNAPCTEEEERAKEKMLSSVTMTKNSFGSLGGN